MHEGVEAIRAELAYVHVQTLIVEKQRRRLEDGMRQFMDSDTGELPEGEHEVDGEMFMFLVRDPGRRTLVPRPLHTGIFDDRYLLVFSKFPNVKGRLGGEEVGLSYNETTVFHPCVHPTAGGGLYCPELYPDNMMAVIVGRELYGFPKRYAQTELSHQEALWILDGELAARATWEGTEEIEDFYAEVASAALGPDDLEGRVARSLLDDLPEELIRQLGESAPIPLFVRWQSGEAGTGRRRDELICIPFHLDDIRSERRLVNPELVLPLKRLRHPRTDPVVELAWTMTASMRLGDSFPAADLRPGLRGTARSVWAVAAAGLRSSGTVLRALRAMLE
jgi:hypothetical protein